MVSDAVRDELRERLLEERRRLEDEISGLSASGVRGDVFSEDETDAADQHPADDASELFEREKNLALQRSAEVSLRLVNEALHRMHDGTYGTCANCGKPIPEKRLQAMPEAIYDIDCQSKLEKAGAI